MAHWLDVGLSVSQYAATVKSQWHEQCHHHRCRLATDVAKTVRQLLSLMDQTQASE